VKGIIPQGKPCTNRLRRLAAARRGVLSPSFPHSLDHVRASTVAISLRSSMKPRYALLIIVISLFMGAGLLSCNTPAPHQTNTESWYTHEREERSERRSIGKIALLGVSVYRSGGWDSIQSEIAGLAPLLFWKHGLYLVPDAAGADYAADIRLHEREYMSQWRTKRSLALEVRIWAVPAEMADAAAFSFDKRLPLAAARVLSSGAHGFSSSHTVNRMLPLAIKNAVKRLHSLKPLKKGSEREARKDEVSKDGVPKDKITASEAPLSADTVQRNQPDEEFEDEIQYQVNDE